MLKFVDQEGSVTLKYTPDQYFDTDIIHDWLFTRGYVGYSRDEVEFVDFAMDDSESGKELHGFDLHIGCTPESAGTPIFTIYTEETDPKEFGVENDSAKNHTVDFLEAFKLQMSKLGYQVVTEKDLADKSVLENNRALIYFKDEKVGMIDEGGLLFIQSEHYKVVAPLFKQVDEVIANYNKSDVLQEPKGYRVLSEFNRIILACKKMASGDFEFATWERDYDGKGVCIGHYFDDYVAAKKDFAQRGNFVEAKEQLTEMELFVIRTGLVKIQQLDLLMPYEKEVDINSLIEKIDMMIPEVEKMMEGGVVIENEDEYELIQS